VRDRTHFAKGTTPLSTAIPPSSRMTKRPQPVSRDTLRNTRHLHSCDVGLALISACSFSAVDAAKLGFDVEVR